jgi:hypothetical protein
MAGIGRINSELVVAKMIGINLQDMTPSAILTVRYLIDSF